MYEQYGFESLLDLGPKFYIVRINDVIVKEDMIELGSNTVTHDTILKYNDLRHVIKKCAKMHACSL